MASKSGTPGRLRFAELGIRGSLVAVVITLVSLLVLPVMVHIGADFLESGWNAIAGLFNDDREKTYIPGEGYGRLLLGFVVALTVALLWWMRVLSTRVVGYVMVAAVVIFLLVIGLWFAGLFAFIGFFGILGGGVIALFGIGSAVSVLGAADPRLDAELDDLF